MDRATIDAVAGSDVGHLGPIEYLPHRVGKSHPEDLAKQARAGSRNGNGELTIKTTAGPITLQSPKLRCTDMAFDRAASAWP